VTPVSQEPDAGTAVPTKSTAEELGERLMETADTMAHDMGIPTAALIAIIVGMHIVTISHNILYCSRMSGWKTVSNHSVGRVLNKTITQPLQRSYILLCTIILSFHNMFRPIGHHQVNAIHYTTYAGRYCVQIIYGSQ
jgi:hypothetical protein